MLCTHVQWTEMAGPRWVPGTRGPPPESHQISFTASPPFRPLLTLCSLLPTPDSFKVVLTAEHLGVNSPKPICSPQCSVNSLIRFLWPPSPEAVCTLPERRNGKCLSWGSWRPWAQSRILAEGMRARRGRPAPSFSRQGTAVWVWGGSVRFATMPGPMRKENRAITCWYFMY